MRQHTKHRHPLSVAACAAVTFALGCADPETPASISLEVTGETDGDDELLLLSEACSAFEPIEHEEPVATRQGGGGAELAMFTFAAMEAAGRDLRIPAGVQRNVYDRIAARLEDMVNARAHGGTRHATPAEIREELDAALAFVRSYVSMFWDEESAPASGCADLGDPYSAYACDRHIETGWALGRVLFPATWYDGNLVLLRGEPYLLEARDGAIGGRIYQWVPGVRRYLDDLAGRRGASPDDLAALYALGRYSRVFRHTWLTLPGGTGFGWTPRTIIDERLWSPHARTPGVPEPLRSITLPHSILRNKTTPSLEYNNQVAAQLGRIPWEQLGIEPSETLIQRVFLDWPARMAYTHWWFRLVPVIGNAFTAAEALLDMLDSERPGRERAAAAVSFAVHYLFAVLDVSLIDQLVTFTGHAARRSAEVAGRLRTRLTDLWRGRGQDPQATARALRQLITSDDARELMVLLNAAGSDHARAANLVARIEREIAASALRQAEARYLGNLLAQVRSGRIGADMYRLPTVGGAAGLAEELELQYQMIRHGFTVRLVAGRYVLDPSTVARGHVTDLVQLVGGARSSAANPVRVHRLHTGWVLADDPIAAGFTGLVEQRLVAGLPNDVVVLMAHGVRNAGFDGRTPALVISLPRSSVAVAAERRGGEIIKRSLSDPWWNGAGGDAALLPPADILRGMGISTNQALPDVVQVAMTPDVLSSVLRTVMRARPGAANLAIETRALQITGLEAVPNLQGLIGRGQALQGSRAVLLSCYSTDFAEIAMQRRYLGEIFSEMITFGRKPIIPLPIPGATQGEYGVYGFGEAVRRVVVPN